MATAGDLIRLGKDTLIFRKTSADTNGEYVEVEVDYAPTVMRPPVHYHPRQQENMHIVSGALTTELDGYKRVYEAGEDLVIDPGVKHSIWNTGPEHTVISWRTSPALQTEQLFETLWSLADEGRITPKGPPLQLALLGLAFRNEYRVVTGRPHALQMALCTLLAPIGLACGYRPYNKPAVHETELTLRQHEANARPLSGSTA